MTKHFTIDRGDVGTEAYEDQYVHDIQSQLSAALAKQNALQKQLDFACESLKDEVTARCDAQAEVERLTKANLKLAHHLGEQNADNGNLREEFKRLKPIEQAARAADATAMPAFGPTVVIDGDVWDDVRTALEARK